MQSNDAYARKTSGHATARDLIDEWALLAPTASQISEHLAYRRLAQLRHVIAQLPEKLPEAQRLQVAQADDAYRCETALLHAPFDGNAAHAPDRQWYMFRCPPQLVNGPANRLHQLQLFADEPVRLGFDRRDAERTRAMRQMLARLQHASQKLNIEDAERLRTVALAMRGRPSARPLPIARATPAPARSGFVCLRQPRHSRYAWPI